MTTKNKTSKPAKKARKPAARAKAKGKSAQFLHKPTCTTCRKARAYMENRGFDLHFRNLDKERLSSEELEKLIGNRDHREFLNTRNELYRQKNMKENPPSRADAIRMMVGEPNLIRRPVIVAGGRVVLGFNQEKIDRL
jgi:Spx/MgsR family transcriptional regulator